jgi:hypothetical protein
MALVLVVFLLFQMMPMVEATTSKEDKEPGGERPAARYTVCRSTNLFDSGGNPIATLSPGTKVTYSSGTWTFGNPTAIYVYYGSTYGYVLSNYVCPTYDCYNVTVSSTYLYTNLTGSSYNYSLSYGTYLYIPGYSGGGTRVYAQIASSSNYGGAGYVTRADVS